MRNLDPHQPGFDSHFAAVGRFMVAFQQVEFALTHHLARVCTNPSRVAPNNLIQSMLGDSSFGKLLKFASTLPVLLDPTRLFSSEQILEEWTTAHTKASADLKSALKDASTVEQRRNQLIHSNWITESNVPFGTGKVYRIKLLNRSGSVVMLHEPITDDLISRETQRCKQVEAELHVSLAAFCELSRKYISHEAASAALHLAPGEPSTQHGAAFQETRAK